MSKDLWFAEMERLSAEFEEQGLSSDAAYEKACDLAYDSMRDKLADRADNERKYRKENPPD